MYFSCKSVCGHHFYTWTSINCYRHLAELTQYYLSDWTKLWRALANSGTALIEQVGRAKQSLETRPEFCFPDFSVGYIFHFDASEAGVGIFLDRSAKDAKDKIDLGVIAHSSKPCTKGQKQYSLQYSTCMKRCCEVVELYTPRSHTSGRAGTITKPATLPSRTCITHDTSVFCHMSLIHFCFGKVLIS